MDRRQVPPRLNNLSDSMWLLDRIGVGLFWTGLISVTVCSALAGTILLSGDEGALDAGGFIGCLGLVSFRAGKAARHFLAGD